MCIPGAPPFISRRTAFFSFALTLAIIAAIPGPCPSAETQPPYGAVSPVTSLPSAEIAPGVTARLAWTRDVMLSMLTLSPGAETPGEILRAERLAVVMEGSVEQAVDGKTVVMRAFDHEPMTPISGRRPRRDCIYLEKGTEHSLKAGDDGAVILELRHPVSAEYLRKAGAAAMPPPAAGKPPGIPSSHAPGSVFDYYDVQFARLDTSAVARIVWGGNLLASFMRIDPGERFTCPGQRGERLSLVLRGSAVIEGGSGAVGMDTGDIASFPGGAAMSFTAGDTGCDLLEVYGSPEPRLVEKMRERLARYHAIIPGDAEIELMADGSEEGPGLVYCEGPSWIDGRLYFSSMGYDARWNGDIAGSAFVEMDDDGTYRHRVRGIETNGTFPLGNGNLAVCDMYGHRVVEMTTAGKVVRVLADSFQGKRLDGPNDLAVDDRGGVYFTDPQIVPRPHMQPGRSVFYRRPDGDIVRVLDPGVLEKPNGLILSPDCKTLYINSTPDNYMLAFDVNDDGTLSNGRRFGELLVTPEIIDRGSVNPQVDGMTVDERGNIYITSILGLQIFDPAGDFVGHIHFPLMPVNCCFGGDDGKTLYVTCNDRIYRIGTRVRGAAYTLKR